MQEKISMHKFFLPAGILLLGMGVYGLSYYFRLHGPADDLLHELPLSQIARVIPESDIPGSTRIDNIWLQTSNQLKIRYRSRFPYSDEIRRLDTNYSLILDGSNIVWGLKHSSGEVQARSYFEEYNIEAKSVGKFCGSFLAVIGVVLLATYVLTEMAWDKSASKEREKLLVDSRKARIVTGLVVYMIIYWSWISPWLATFLPRFALSLIWLAGAAVLMTLLGGKAPIKS